MENLIALQLQLIQWLQALGDWLTSAHGIFIPHRCRIVLPVGRPSHLLVLGYHTGLTNWPFLDGQRQHQFLLKILLHTARPFWISTSIKHLAFESSFGLPSGHAQNADSFLGYSRGLLPQNAGCGRCSLCSSSWWVSPASTWQFTFLTMYWWAGW